MAGHGAIRQLKFLNLEAMNACMMPVHQLKRYRMRRMA